MRFALVAVITAQFAAFALSAPEEGPLDRARKAFTEGRYEEVITLCAEVPEADPLKPRAHYLAGEAELLLGKAAEAEKSFRKVLERKPEAVPAKTGLGQALTALGRHEEAVKIHEEAVKDAPSDAGAQRALGEALAAAGRKNEARKALDKAYGLNPKDPLTARSLVDFLVASETLDEARTVAVKLAKALPKHPMGPFLLGLVHDRLGEDEKAIAAYEEALKRDDGFLDAHKNLAILCHTKNPVYQDTERTKKALEHYARYFALGGKDPTLERVYLQLKGFLESMGGR